MKISNTNMKLIAVPPLPPLLLLILELACSISSFRRPSSWRIPGHASRGGRGPAATPAHPPTPTSRMAQFTARARNALPSNCSSMTTCPAPPSELLPPSHPPHLHSPPNSSMRPTPPNPGEPSSISLVLVSPDPEATPAPATRAVAHRFPRTLHAITAQC